MFDIQSTIDIMGVRGPVRCRSHKFPASVEYIPKSKNVILRNEVSQGIENKRKPINSAGRFGGYTENVRKIQRLEEAGIIFIDDDIGGVGVRLKKRPPRA